MHLNMYKTTHNYKLFQSNGIQTTAAIAWNDDFMWDHKFFFMQESLLRCGKEAILRKGNELERKKAMKKLGQTSLVLGLFVLTAFTVQKIFV